MMRLGALLSLVVIVAVLGPFARLGTAQDATPAAGLGEAIDPAECRVEPRSVDELIALWYQEDAAGTPVLATPEPPAGMFPTSVPAPLGEPADAETVAAVIATVREAIACSNAGDFRRLTALFSDDVARQFGPEPGTSAEDARAFLEAPAEPLPTEERWRLIAVTDVSVLEDGRVGLLFVSDDPAEPPEGPETEFVVLVEERGRWVVDGVAEFTVVEEAEE